MKKIVFLLAFVTFLTGCSFTKENNGTNVENNNNNVVENNNSSNTNNNNTENSNNDNSINSGDSSNGTNSNVQNITNPSEYTIELNSTTIPTVFEYTTLDWNSNNLLAKIPVLSYGTFMGAYTDDGCVELYYKNLTYEQMKNYVSSLGSDFKEANGNILNSTETDYSHKYKSETHKMKVYAFYFIDKQIAKIVVYQNGYFKEV